MIPFTGSIVALVTPMLEDGSVDYPALKRLIDWHIQEGTACVCVVGTTGESPTVDVEEHCQIIKTAVEHAAGRIPIMAGTGANSTREAIALSRFAKQVGADCALSVVPYYNKPSQEGIYQHFKAIAEAVDLPTMLYNVPGRTVADMLPDTTLRCAGLPGVFGIKEASGNLDQIATILKHRPKDFLVISGDDALTLPILALGGDGVISVVGNALPTEFARLVEAAMAGDMPTARREHFKLLEFMTQLFAEGNPGGIKEALKTLGLCGNQLRLPLVPVSEATAKKIYHAMADAEVVKL